MEEQISKFKQNEIGLCYDPDPLKAKTLYEAKILDIGVTKDDKGRKVAEYYVHFQGWNKSWDRWVLEDQILKNNDTNKALQAKLYEEAIKVKKRIRRPIVKSDTSDNDEGDDESSGDSESDEENEQKLNEMLSVTLSIPKVLAIKLEDDCYNINRKKKLIRLPRIPCVADIFQNYFTHCEAESKAGDLKKMSVKMVEEYLEGMHVYFNYYLETLLLYQFEREQYKIFFPTINKSDMNETPNKAKLETGVGKKRSLSTWKVKDENSKSIESRKLNKQTRKFTKDPINEQNSVQEGVSKRLRSSQIPRDSTSVQADNEDKILFPSSPSNSLAREKRLTRKRPIEKYDENKAEENLSKVKNPQPKISANHGDRNQDEISSLRRSSRASKTPVKSNNVEETDVLVPVNCSTSVTNNTVIKTINYNVSKNTTKGKVASSEEKSFIFFPLTIDGKRPADVYGPEHLLRLFVKLPIILASSSFEEPRVETIIHYTSNFLGYLTESIDMFQSSVYSESAI